MLNDFWTAGTHHQTGSSITCYISFNAAHAIFKGHFPQQPIVPGVCTMHIVKALLESAVQQKLTLRESSAVKFLRLVTPELSPEVSIEWQEDAGIITAASTFKDAGTAIFKMTATYSAR